jgi:polar amino acid transport system substrate-binding protein
MVAKPDEWHRVAGWIGIACLSAWCGGCDWPRDGKGTLQEVIGGTLMAGIMQGPPWANLEGGKASGIEVRLVEELCRELGCRVQWVQGGETELMSALEHFEIDLVIGGLTRETPWDGRIGLTRPFIETKLVVAVPSSQPAIDSIAGVRVRASPGTNAAALVRSEGGIPVGPGELLGPPFAIAIEEWQVGSRGLRACPIRLEKRERVWAIPPGENAWLFRVDQFLHRHQQEIPQLATAGRNQ